MMKIFRLFFALTLIINALPNFQGTAQAKIAESVYKRFVVNSAKEGEEKAWDVFERLKDGTLDFKTSIGDSKFNRFKNRYIAPKKKVRLSEGKYTVPKQKILKKDLKYFLPVGVGALQGDPVLMRVILGAKNQLEQIHIFDQGKEKVIIIDFTASLSDQKKLRVNHGYEKDIFAPKFKRIGDVKRRILSAQKVNEPFTPLTSKTFPPPTKPPPGTQPPTVPPTIIPPTVPPTVPPFTTPPPDTNTPQTITPPVTYPPGGGIGKFGGPRGWGRGGRGPQGKDKSQPGRLRGEEDDYTKLNEKAKRDYFEKANLLKVIQELFKRLLHRKNDKKVIEEYIKNKKFGKDTKKVIEELLGVRQPVGYKVSAYKKGVKNGKIKLERLNKLEETRQKHQKTINKNAVQQLEWVIKGEYRRFRELDVSMMKNYKKAMDLMTNALEKEGKLTKRDADHVRIVTNKIVIEKLDTDREELTDPNVIDLSKTGRTIKNLDKDIQKIKKENKDLIKDFPLRDRDWIQYVIDLFKWDGVLPEKRPDPSETSHVSGKYIPGQPQMRIGVGPIKDKPRDNRFVPRERKKKKTRRVTASLTPKTTGTYLATTTGGYSGDGTYTPGQDKTDMGISASPGFKETQGGYLPKDKGKKDLTVSKTRPDKTVTRVGKEGHLYTTGGFKRITVIIYIHHPDGRRSFFVGRIPITLAGLLAGDISRGAGPWNRRPFIGPLQYNNLTDLVTDAWFGGNTPYVRGLSYGFSFVQEREVFRSYVTDFAALFGPGYGGSYSVSGSGGWFGSGFKKVYAAPVAFSDTYQGTDMNVLFIHVNVPGYPGGPLSGDIIPATLEAFNAWHATHGLTAFIDAISFARIIADSRSATGAIIFAPNGDRFTISETFRFDGNQHGYTITGP